MYSKKGIKVRHTLAFRLTLWYAGIFSLSACIAFIFFYFLMTSMFRDQTDRDLYRQAGIFSTIMATDGVEDVKRFAALESQASGEKKIFYRLFYPTGISFSSSNMSYWQDIGVTRENIEQALQGNSQIYETLTIPGRVEQVRILYSNIGAGVILQLGQSLENVASFVEAFRRIVIATLSMLVLLSAGFGWFMARRAVSGVQAVTRTARSISAGSLEERVPVNTRGDEIDQLATTFNAMLDRIQHLVVGIQEIGDNVAHDLKSPLTRIRGAAEIALTTGKSMLEFEQMAASSIEECDHLLDMINTMLMISQTEAGVGELVKTDVDLTQIVKDACELFQPMATDKGVHLVCSDVEAATLHGDISLLQRLVANLVDNAIKYTQADGRVDVSLHAKKNHEIVLTVVDTGVGILEVKQPHVFERFYRCDPSRSTAGAGLGLSLAKAIAEAHQGRIHVESRAGKGSVFKVLFQSAKITKW
ncbi:MAG: ATP-binding protein [Desulfobacterales bacterium]|nr:ATP-binding protein [Desulfobacterales bacterium]MDX2511110.1 ATP-binding protein [Desulfobacterales bacterium]